MTTTIELADLTIRGCYIPGEPERGPSYSCGGTPATDAEWDDVRVEVGGVSVDERRYAGGSEIKRSGGSMITNERLNEIIPSGILEIEDDEVVAICRELLSYRAQPTTDELMMLPEDARLFIMDITLHLQSNRNKTPNQHDAMFQRAYRLYTKYNVEKQNTPAPAAPVVAEPAGETRSCQNCDHNNHDDAASGYCRKIAIDAPCCSNWEAAKQPAPKPIEFDQGKWREKVCTELDKIRKRLTALEKKEGK